MKYSLQLTFDGLCAFKVRDKVLEAYLPHGHDHGGNLVLRTDFLDVPRSTWMPAAVGLIHDAKDGPRQIGIWKLHGDDVRFENVAEADPPDVKEKGRLVEFGVEHSGSSTLTKSEIRLAYPKVGIVTLAGKSTFEPVPTTEHDNFSLKKNGVKHKDRACSRMANWMLKSETRPLIRNKAGEVLILREGTASGGITNAAPVLPDVGLTHFVHYYEGVTLAGGDHKMTIQSAFIDVFDCVPPVMWP